MIQKTIDQCDYYVVIVAHRYGSTTSKGLSFTEKEYEYAVKQGVPVLGFVIDPKAPWPNDRTDKDPTCIQALQRFKFKVKRRMVRSWTDKSVLHAQFVTSLTTYIKSHPRRGWVRAPEAGTPDVGQTLAKLTDENARLRRTVEEMRSKGEINDIIDLLATQKIGHRSGSELFVDVIESDARIIPIVFIYQQTKPLSGDEHDDQRRVLSEAFDKFRAWGLLLEPIGGMDWAVTPLGQRVYNRLDLGRRSSPENSRGAGGR